MDEQTEIFLRNVRYMTKEEYLDRKNQLKKEWKKNWNKISNEIRSLRRSVKCIGQNEISWRDFNLFHGLYDTDNYDTEQNLKDSIAMYAKDQGLLQSIRSDLSKDAKFMLDCYMNDLAFLKQCAHYSYVMDRLMEETNHRFV